jgi:prolyl-tRNA editing enzyme YbaK/EbsC (Cys-tRNA(Pro) deacylase)
MGVVYSNEIAWYRDPSTYNRTYGLQSRGGEMWAVVQEDNTSPRQVFKTLIVVSGRQTAVGFIKLLLEK